MSNKVPAALYRYELGLRGLEQDIDDEDREEYQRVVRLLTELRKKQEPEKFFGKGV